jgi:hypothetical protein
MSRRIIRVPKSHQGPLARLLALSESDFVSLRRALENLPPSLSLEDLAKKVASETGIDSDDSYGMLRVLASLYSARDSGGMELTRFLEDVLEAAEATGAPGLSGDGLDRARAKRYLKELLSLHKTLGISSKAFDVFSEHQNLFCNARILTDVRPVFSDDVKSEPEAFVVSHTLRISYHEGDELKAVFLALDSSELRDLSRTIDRALSKQRTLERLMKNSQLSVLSAPEED